MFEDSNLEHGTETGAGQAPSPSEHRDRVYHALDNMGSIVYGARIPIAMIRQLLNQPEPDITGLGPREIRKAFQDDAFALLSLKEHIFTKYLMKAGMAIRQEGEFWIIPTRREMPAVWARYAKKANVALNKARWLMKSAPNTSGEDAAFAQMQASRVARRVAKLTEQAAMVGTNIS